MNKESNICKCCSHQEGCQWKYPDTSSEACYRAYLLSVKDLIVKR